MLKYITPSNLSLRCQGSKPIINFRCYTDRIHCSDRFTAPIPVGAPISTEEQATVGRLQCQGVIVITRGLLQLGHGLHRLRERQKQRISGAEDAKERGMVLQQECCIPWAGGRFRREGGEDTDDPSEERAR